MNTDPGNPKILQCEKCPNVFMTVKSQVIGLAFPRPVHHDFATKNPLKGICPAHRKKLNE